MEGAVEKTEKPVELEMADDLPSGYVKIAIENGH